MSRNCTGGGGGPSLKKKFVGLIRTLSQPGGPSHSTTAGLGHHTTSHTIVRPDTFIHKYLQGEARSAQPPIIFGRTCEALPSRPLRCPQDQVVSAFTGPGGGLASVNKEGQKPLQPDEPDLGYIDEDDLPSESQPNAYVTSQKPPPQPDPDLKRSETEEIAGLVNWNRPNRSAFGISTTLYERHPVTNERAGNPIADSFGVVGREDSALLALADGVNWGEKASIAARCAIHGCLQHLNTTLFNDTVDPPTSTTDVFVCLLRSFHAAHSLILQEDGMLTTLTAAVVLPLADSPQYAICVCNVGDSLAYVYSNKYGVREITQGSHDIHSTRDMRDALGALGPVDGQNPELNNLTCSMTYCDPGDIVFLTSDGISDNFDPVVGKFAMPKKEKESKPGKSKEPLSEKDKLSSNMEEAPTREKQNSSTSSRESSGESRRTGAPSKPTRGSRSNSERKQQSGRSSKSLPAKTESGKNTTSGPGRGSSQKTAAHRVKSSGAGLPEDEVPNSDPYLPVVEAHQRHELTLLRMEDLLRCGLTSAGPVVTAQGLCLEMVHFATKLTVAKRRILEDPDLYASASQELSRADQRNRRRKVCEKLALVPGKLDHATVVAYKVGRYSYGDEEPPPMDYRSPSRPNSLVAPLASPDSTKSIVSQLEDCKIDYRKVRIPATHEESRTRAPRVSSAPVNLEKGGKIYSQNSSKKGNKENLSPNTLPGRPKLIETKV